MPMKSTFLFANRKYFSVHKTLNFVILRFSIIYYNKILTNKMIAGIHELHPEKLIEIFFGTSSILLEMLRAHLT